MVFIVGVGKGLKVIHRRQKISREVMGSKSILQILAILRELYGVMGPTKYVISYNHDVYYLHCREESM